MDKKQLKQIIKEEYQNVAQHFENKYGFKPEMGKVYSNPYANAFKTITEDENDTPASPEEMDMSANQLKFIHYAAGEIEDYLKGQQGGFPEWLQNKLTDVHSKIKDIHSYIEGERFGQSNMNESVSPKDMDKIKSAVESASSFMGVGSELKKAGIRYVFATSPMPIYIVQPTPNNKVAIVNKKYASKPDFVYGDIAVGIMESKGLTEALKPETIKFLKGMAKIKVKGLGGWMPGVDYVYYDKNKKQFWFVDTDGDYSELSNTSTLKQLHSFIEKNKIQLESLTLEGIMSDLDLIKKSSKDVKDFITNVLKDKRYSKYKTDKDFIKFLSTF